MELETIHSSLLNGQRRQVVDQIIEYEPYKFFTDYKAYLFDVYAYDYETIHNYYSSATRAYVILTTPARV